MPVVKVPSSLMGQTLQSIAGMLAPNFTQQLKKCEASKRPVSDDSAQQSELLSVTDFSTASNTAQSSAYVMLVSRRTWGSRYRGRNSPPFTKVDYTLSLARSSIPSISLEEVGT
jgi:hypothetical protein